MLILLETFTKYCDYRIIIVAGATKAIPAFQKLIKLVHSQLDIDEFTTLALVEILNSDGSTSNRIVILTNHITHYIIIST